MSNNNTNIFKNINKNSSPMEDAGEKIKSFGKKVGTTIKENTGTTLIIILLVLVLIIIIIVLAVRNAKKENKRKILIINDPMDAYDIKQNEFIIQNSSEGLEFSYSFWIYIQDWTNGWKNIFVKGDKQTAPGNSSARAPGLWLYPDTNALHARINTFASPNEGCDIKNIPLQKWVHIVYVLNNRTVDIYINGKLERSCVLRGVPKLNDKPLFICDNGGFFGKISQFMYFKYAMNPDEVFSIYNKGPY